MALLSAFASGLLFGFGLLVSRMAYPDKVLGFLDVAGAWDASLLFTMAAAVAVASVAFGFAGRRRKSLLGLPMHVPAKAGITRRLLLGSATFGVGWGLVGFCPGPALVALGAGTPKALVFVGGMLLGMLAFELLGHGAQRGRACAARDSAADA